jgi:hypothetical protein
MKFILVLTLLMPFSLAAQFSKGDKMLGGSVGFNRYQSRNDNMPSLNRSVSMSRQTYISVQPEIGFFLSERFVMGGHIEYNLNYRKDITKRVTGTQITTDDTQSFSFGLLFRRYFTITDKFFFALDGIPFCQIFEGYALGARIHPVLTFLPTDRWGFEGSFGNISYRYRDSNVSNQKSDSFDFSLGNLSLGIRYYMRKRRE